MAIDTFALPKAKRVRTQSVGRGAAGARRGDAQRAAHDRSATSTCRRGCWRAPRPRRSSSPTSPIGTHQVMSRADVRAHGRAPGRLHRRAGDGAGRGLHRLRPRPTRTARAPVHRGGQRQHRRDAAAAVLRPLDDERRSTPELTVIYTPNLEAEGYPGRPPDRGRPRAAASRASSTPTTSASRRRAGCACGTSSSTTAAACRCTPAARSSRRRAATRVGLIVGLSGTGKTTTTFTQAERLAAGAGRLRGLVPDGRVSGDRGRLLRQDVRALRRGRADHPRRRDAPEAYLENVSQDDDGQRSTSSTRATRRTGARPSRSRSIEAADARELERRDFLLILNRNENIIPAVAQAHAASRPRPTSCSARRRARAPAAPRRRASSCACRAPTRSSRCRTTCRATASSS